MWPLPSPRQRLIRRALREGRVALEKQGAKAIEVWTDHDHVLLVIRWPGREREQREFA